MRLTVPPTAAESLMDPLRVHPLEIPPRVRSSRAIVTEYGMVIQGMRSWFGYPTGWDGRAASRVGPYDTSGDALTALAGAPPVEVTP